MSRIVPNALFIMCLLALGSALEAAPVRSAHVEADLIAEVESIQPGKVFTVGLRMKHDEHWHSYWKNAGDSGAPTTIHWTLPSGFQAGEIQWPVPRKIETPPLMSYGYEGEIWLLIDIIPPTDPKPGDIVTLKAEATWLACQNICIPGEGSFELKLPVKAEPAKPVEKWAKTFVDARAKQPKSTNLTLKAEQNTSAFRLIVPKSATEPGTAYFFSENGELVNHIEKQALTREANGDYGLSIPIAVNTKSAHELKGILQWNGQAWEISVPLTTAPIVEKVVAKKSMTLWIALFFSFVGGLILNLMPCVLPVLSLKVLGFVKQAGEDPTTVWRHGVVFAIGVLISFWLLAGTLLMLRAAGSQVGWGFQLQSPVFVALLAILFFLITLNLYGVFEFGASLIALQAKADEKEGLSGSFWSGVLATVVATPCTAPFMSSALGFAASQSAAVALLIFTSLALGMASPYLLLSIFPQALRFVPKPGVWMESFKQFLSFPMAATVAGLVWVFGWQTGNNGVIQLLLALVLIGLSAWIYGRWVTPIRTERVRWTAIILAVVIALVGTGWAIQVARTSEAPSTAEKKNGEWEPYSPERLKQLRAEGKPVFIDFTAAWCVTCQVNKQVALHRREVLEKFRAKGVVLMEADWTKQDPVITKALAEFGRNGVPVYVLYAPGREPETWPEVLTPKIILDALSKLP